jgi:hypothetical protein
MLARAAYRKFLGGGSTSNSVSNTPKAEEPQGISSSNTLLQNNLNEDMSASAEDFKIYTRTNDYPEHESYTVMNIDENERFDHKNNSWSSLNLLPSDPSRYLLDLFLLSFWLNYNMSLEYS